VIISYLLYILDTSECQRFTLAGEPLGLLEIPSCPYTQAAGTGPSRSKAHIEAIEPNSALVKVQRWMTRSSRAVRLAQRFRAVACCRLGPVTISGPVMRQRAARGVNAVTCAKKGRTSATALVFSFPYLTKMRPISETD
jgi:hypothetical protein